MRLQGARRILRPAVALHYTLLLLDLLLLEVDAWWLMAQMSSSQLPSDYCRAMPELSNRQRTICYQNPEATRALHAGLKQAFSECPNQFNRERWNCSLGLAGRGQALQKRWSSPIHLNDNHPVIFSLSAGGASHAIARACAQGLIPDCGCGDLAEASRMRRAMHIPSPYDQNARKMGLGSGATSYKEFPTMRGSGGAYQYYSNQHHQQQAPSSGTMAGDSSTKEFIWAGCSDNVKYGNTFSRKFIDSVEKQVEREQSNARARMNLHNNRVGRKLLASNRRKQCKCHGVSGSCVTKTCWLSVPAFDEFASLLKRKYQRAQRVALPPGSAELVVVGINETRAAGRNGRNLRPEQTTLRPHTTTKAANKGDLVYLDLSPDYCESDPTNELGGTAGRECFSAQECSTLCCGRGWNTMMETRHEPCRCKFIWCCDVKCETCQKEVQRYFCK